MTANQISASIDILSSLAMFYIAYFYTNKEKLNKYNYKIFGNFSLLSFAKIGWPFVLAMGILKFLGYMAA